MKRLQSLSVALFLFAAGNLCAFAQQNTAPIPVASSSCNTDAAVEIIQQQLAETKTYDDDERRLTVMIRAADLLWPYQAEKSRAAFVEAFELAIQYFNEKGDEPRREGVGVMITTPDMRYTVIAAIVRRDPAWARKLTDKLVNEQVSAAKDKGFEDAVRQGRNAEKLLSIASSLVTSNQAVALNLAGQSLRFPATMYLTMFLYDLAGVNRTAADRFYQTALASYAQAPMDRFLYLSAYPFGNAREVGEMPGSAIYRIPADFTPNAGLQRLFLQTLLSRVQRQIAGPSGLVPGSRVTEPKQMWLALTGLEKQIGQTIPDLGPAVEQAKVGLNAQLPETAQKRVGEITSPLNPPPGSFAERVEAAEKNSNVDRRDQILVSTVVAAPAKEDLDSVLSAVNKISDSGTRTQLLNWFYFTRTQSAIIQGDLVRARTLAAKVEELDQRGFLYFRIADESLKQSVDQTQAREMLEEVVEAAAKAPATTVSARTQLGVAYLYSKLDPTRAIAVLGDAIKTINRLESPDFSRQFVMRRIEGKEFGVYAALLTPGFNPENALKEIAKSDFDGTLYQASNFTSKPLRALTTLAVIEPCLKVTKNPGRGTPKPKASRH